MVDGGLRTPMGPADSDEVGPGGARGEGVGGTSRIRSGLALGLAFLMVAGCSPVDDLMVAIFGRSMRDQPSYSPYENPRPAPEGSVPLSSGNLPPGPFEVNIGQAEGTPDPPPAFTQADVSGQADIVVNLENPVSPTERSLERGEVLYTRNCAPCHGDTGVGTDAYIAEVHPMLAAFDLTSDAAREFSDGYLYGIIRMGRGLMPPYAHQVGHFDRWHIVNYVRQLQGVLPGGEGDPESAGGETE